jgi:hypothetical protein
MKPSTKFTVEVRCCISDFYLYIVSTKTAFMNLQVNITWPRTTFRFGLSIFLFIRIANNHL